MPLLIGTSGWQYRDWRGGLYPEGVPQRRWLEHYAARYLTVENNNSFYRLPSRETFAAYGLSEATIMDLRRWAQAWADDINQRIYRDTVDEDELP